MAEQGVLTRAMVGERVESLMCNGFQPGEVLTQQEREQIAGWAAGFEECDYSREKLMEMSDRDLVSTAYWVMADYARGQV